jgi:uric acid transporter
MFFALGELCGRRVGSADLSRGLAAVGLGTLVGGLFNAVPCACLPQNVGLVAMTWVRSRWVGAVAGAILVALGLFPKLGSVVAAIPQPVLGGAALVLFGMVAASGIRILARSDYLARENPLIIAVSVGVGMIPAVAPTFFGLAPRWLSPLTGSGITLAALVAVLLNALFNGAAPPTDEHAEAAGKSAATTQKR